MLLLNPIQQKWLNAHSRVDDDLGGGGRGAREHVRIDDGHGRRGGQSGGQGRNSRKGSESDSEELHVGLVDTRVVGGVERV